MRNSSNCFGERQNRTGLLAIRRLPTAAEPALPRDVAATIGDVVAIAFARVTNGTVAAP